MLHAEVVTEPAELERLAPEWEQLADEAGAPAALPGWQLAWRRHAAAPGSLLRAVVVRDAGGRLVGLAPYEALPEARGRWSWRLLAAGPTHRVEPLAAPERRADVAAALAGAIAAADPPPGALRFEAADADGAWLEALRAAWPGRVRPWALTDERSPAPYADLLHDSYDAWLATRSSNFRQQARRFRRRLEAAGGVVRMTRTADELERDVEAFVHLHHLRRDERGGSALSRELAPLLCDAGRALLPSERFRLWLVELEGRAVAAHLFLAAGGTVLYWNGGFDPDQAQLRPSLVGLLAALEDCIGRGERTLDLGGGAHDYKLRIADGDRPLAWSVLVPYDRRVVRNRTALARRELRHAAKRLLRRTPAAQR